MRWARPPTFHKIPETHQRWLTSSRSSAPSPPPPPGTQRTRLSIGGESKRTKQNARIPCQKGRKEKQRQGREASELGKRIDRKGVVVVGRHHHHQGICETKAAFRLFAPLCFFFFFFSSIFDFQKEKKRKGK